MSQVVTKTIVRVENVLPSGPASCPAAGSSADRALEPGDGEIVEH
ncbi:hypothetical protein [Streptomyces sp. HUAS TT20]|nr:hypothetical protein [Streptomyces sp. HUAS 15-9]UXY30427.1 hypothetical protein N8I87_30350 [Streptomyces sp. HUAS 15-9]